MHVQVIANLTSALANLLGLRIALPNNRCMQCLPYIVINVSYRDTCLTLFLGYFDGS
jgi:hypothetical protein